MEFMTVDEVAERVRVTRRTVYDWLLSGKLRGLKAGRVWRIRPVDVDDFLNRRGVRLDNASWQEGFDAGKAGKPSLPPAGTADELAWLSGYIEGKAEQTATRAQG